ncbi:hypothetical protein HDV00_005619 [Rhizophlyctis rosea]|nr:hypothetical protein HDV00_005619 [Rhizophlyctis rosea]
MTSSAQLSHDLASKINALVRVTAPTGEANHPALHAALKELDSLHQRVTSAYNTGMSATKRRRRHRTPPRPSKPPRRRRRPLKTAANARAVALKRGKRIADLSEKCAGREEERDEFEKSCVQYEDAAL